MNDPCTNLTAGVRQVLEDAERESVRLNAGFLAPEHLLLALWQENGTAGRVLRMFESDISKIRAEVNKAFEGRTALGILQVVLSAELSQVFSLASEKAQRPIQKQIRQCSTAAGPAALSRRGCSPYRRATFDSAG